MTASSHVMAALACVSREVPEARARMDARLGGRRVALILDGETTHVSLTGGVDGEPDVVVRTTVDTLYRVLRGDDDLLDAILADRVSITGAPDALIAASEAMTWFLEGAVRCLSIVPIADALFASRSGGAG